jgi:hypothetical protein
MTNAYKYIKIIKNNKCLIRIKLNQTPERYNTNKGEVDIIFDAKRKRRRYEEEYRKFRRPIKSIDTGQLKYNIIKTGPDIFKNILWRVING